MSKYPQDCPVTKCQLKDPARTDVVLSEPFKLSANSNNADGQTLKFTVNCSNGKANLDKEVTLTQTSQCSDSLSVLKDQPESPVYKYDPVAKTQVVNA